MTMYNTDSFTDERRVKNWQGFGQFNKCEFCKLEQTPERRDSDDSKYAEFCGIKYRHQHRLILCDRCTDKLNSLMNGKDVDEYWEPEDAKKDGFPDFPYGKAMQMTWDKDWRNK